jgi:L-lactate utilization protein LutC
MRYDQLASDISVATTAKGLAERGMAAEVLSNGAAALARIKELIPKGVTVMNGSSVTLEQIGFVEYLKSGEHGWNNLHAGILAENDKEKRAALRQQSSLSEYYLGSVHALAETGEFLIASNTGSQLPHIVFTSANLVYVVSTKKIVPTLADAFNRLDEHVIPLEDKHMMDLYKVHTFPSKTVVVRRENPMMGRKVTVLLVAEDLGF